MILEGQITSYEIIQILPEADGNFYCRGRRMDMDGGVPAKDDVHAEDAQVFLVGVPLGERILSMVPVWQENLAFVDLTDYLIQEDRIFLVFCDVAGKPLADVLESMNVMERFLVGRLVIEQFLIQELPLGLRWEMAEKGDVYVDFAENREPQIHLFYRLGAVEQYGSMEEEDGAESLLMLLELLLSSENSGIRPQVEAFLERERSSGEKGLMALYKDYLMLLPALNQENSKSEQVEKKSLLERITGFWKARGKKILSLVKVGAGLLTICAALVLLPQVWREKIKPVVDGAALWKSIYVDGETFPEEVDETPSVDAGEGAESRDVSGNTGTGRRTFYWDHGGVRYEGGVQDEKYEGTGTLYYKSGGVEYQGDFAFGKREGTGIIYLESGQILYEGGFHNDRYEGEGRLYEAEHGAILYEGGFKTGKYSGEGTLYEPLSDFPRYVGGFRLGHYDGVGVEYDGNGCMRYEGDFLLGVYHGNGRMYDPEFGSLIFEGAFRNGMPVIPEEEMSDGEELLTEPAKLPEESVGEGLSGGEPEESLSSESPEPSKSPVIGPVYRHKKSS